MAEEPKYIHNLPISAHIDYAERASRLDPTFTKDSGPVARQAEVASFLPHVAFLGEWLEEYFQFNRRFRSWSSFKRPTKNAANPNTIFSHQILPSLGSDEALEKHLEAIRSIAPKKGKKNKKETNADKMKLADFIGALILLDKLIRQVNGERSRYHKG